jgi:hypothetical protein
MLETMNKVQTSPALSVNRAVFSAFAYAVLKSNIFWSPVSPFNYFVANDNGPIVTVAAFV